MNLIEETKKLCALCGVSGEEGAVREYLKAKIEDFPDILETRTDALGNLLVHKKGKNPAKHTLLIGAHMDEVGLIVTGIQDDGLCTIAPVGGVDADVVIGRAVENPIAGTGVIGAKPVHKLTKEEREQKPDFKDLLLDLGCKTAEDARKIAAPGDCFCFRSEWTALGGGKVASKAIDDRFGCAAMLCMLAGEIEYDTWFAFFVQEEIGLRGSGCAAYAINPDFAVILETTTAADLDGVTGDAAVCKLGSGPVVSFMDRRTIYDKTLYRLGFDTAAELGIPCQTKTRIAGGNDAGSVHLTREGVRTMAISIPCRCLHSPYCVAQVSDMEQSLALAQAMLAKIQEL
ncbi:MAG: M42 family peptidase [Oscillospiraceae bacterium]|nr:M42 family peptidase [Oscillospiraceae bacterium]